jgi:hypothetical protein
MYPHPLRFDYIQLYLSFKKSGEGVIFAGRQAALQCVVFITSCGVFACIFPHSILAKVSSHTVGGFFFLDILDSWQLLLVALLPSFTHEERKGPHEGATGIKPNETKRNETSLGRIHYAAVGGLDGPAFGQRSRAA